MSEQFCDVGRGITLCYESFGAPSDPPLLLIMGLGTQMIGWDEEFCEELAGRGFHVVRFDNRDIGRSTHLDFRAPGTKQLLTRRFGPEQYDLGDMATDAFNLLTELDMAPAHIAGASMGGMIAQTLAARHPEAVRSLTSIMSTTGSRRVGQPNPRVYPRFMAARPTERQLVIDSGVEFFSLVGSPPPNGDPDRVRASIERSIDRDGDRFATGRQLAGILKSGNRTKEVRGISAPTLVIHGDKDKLIGPSGGRATAAAIEGARLVKIKGMGHDLPPAFWPQIVDAIDEHAHGVDAAGKGDAVEAGRSA